MYTKDEQRQQVRDQCRVVAHLARALAEVYEAKSNIFTRSGPADELIDWTGPQSASLMETLGDILNGMDACDEEDAWTDPIFKKAQEFWLKEPSS